MPDVVLISFKFDKWNKERTSFRERF